MLHIFDTGTRLSLPDGLCQSGKASILECQVRRVVRAAEEVLPASSQRSTPIRIWIDASCTPPSHPALHEVSVVALGIMNTATREAFAVVVLDTDIASLSKKTAAMRKHL